MNVCAGHGALVGYVLFRFGRHFEGLLDALRVRVQSGSAFKAGPFELGQDLQSLEKVTSDSIPKSALLADDDWPKERDGIYQANSGLFLAHVIEPSADPEQLYDIFIFLVRHKSDLWSDVERKNGGTDHHFMFIFWRDPISRPDLGSASKIVPPIPRGTVVTIDNM